MTKPAMITRQSTVMAYISVRRLQNKINGLFGFRKNRITTDVITTLRIILQKLIEFNEKLDICVNDWENVFDSVNWNKLMETLK